MLSFLKSIFLFRVRIPFWNIWPTHVKEIKLSFCYHVVVDGKLLHGRLEEQVLCQGQVGVEVVDQVEDRVWHVQGVARALKDQLDAFAVEKTLSEIKFYIC